MLESRQANKEKSLSLLQEALDHGLNLAGDLEIETASALQILHGDARFIALVAHAKSVAQSKTAVAQKK